jgi:undecaprenyl-diphosphatase
VEERFLLTIREAIASPVLDAVFLVSHHLATLPVCTALVIVAMVLWWRRDRRESVLWAGLGLTTLMFELFLKRGVGRTRPQLWTSAIVERGFAFPSGHALASITFYTLIARAVAIRWPERARLAYAGAAAMALYIGFGRLYLGVHWPSDVLAGWTLGAVQTLVAMTLVDRWKRRVTIARGDTR